MNKSEARNRAIEIQKEITNKILSYSELLVYQEELLKLGKRYVLIKEFRNEGLI